MDKTYVILQIGWSTTWSIENSQFGVSNLDNWEYLIGKIGVPRTNKTGVSLKLMAPPKNQFLRQTCFDFDHGARCLQCSFCCSYY